MNLQVEETTGVDVIRKKYHKLGKFLAENGIKMHLITLWISFFFLLFWSNLSVDFLCDCSALQLHPDKNKHPKAEMAFKIVSEVWFIH